MTFHSIRLALLSLLVLMLCGCPVRSVQPTYLESSVITDFDKYRYWQPLSEKGSPLDEPLWERKDAFVNSTEKDKETEQLKAVFFKVGGGTYLDVAYEPHNGGEEARAFMLPTHCLYRVTLQGDIFHAAPLNDVWLEKLLAGEKTILPHTIVKDGERKISELIVTAAPEEWAKFLESYGNNPEAFEPAAGFNFRGLAQAPQTPPG